VIEAAVDTAIADKIRWFDAPGESPG
jgi:hypothetical protein